MGAGWCPPGMLGIGIGGSAEKAMLLAKEALMEPIDMAELKARGPASKTEELRIELYEKVNALGIGAQGPKLSDWPKIDWAPAPGARRVNLDTLTPAEVASWQPGESLLLNGKMLTGRDAAHKRIADLFAKGEKLPAGVDFHNRVIYYVGPVDPVRGEVVGPAGPTTATRMDKFTDMMLEKTGLIAMVGKAERGPTGVDAIRKHRAAYLMAVGGAAYLVSKAIKASRVVAFEDLGMEAIYEFTVEDMPVTVAVDANGTSVHQTGPAEWSQKIAHIRSGTQKR
jgi:fumarate hydratase, class I